MIKRSTFFMILLAGLIGVGIFQLKYNVVSLEEDLWKVQRQILSEQEATHVLKAEWAYLNEPARLQKLSQEHLKLRPIASNQLVSVDVLSDMSMFDVASLNESLEKETSPKKNLSAIDQAIDDLDNSVERSD